MRSDTPINELSSWWAPWVTLLIGLVLGLVATLVLLHSAKALLQLCLSDCEPKRAWPDCFCWRQVCEQLSDSAELKGKNCLYTLQASHSRMLVNQLDGQDSVNSYSMNGGPSVQAGYGGALSSPSLKQRLEAAFCGCMGHHRG